MEALATWHLVLRRPPAEVGGWGGVEPMRESPSSGPSEPCDCHVPLLSLILPLPHLRRRRLCVCACVHLGPLSVESNFAKLLGRTHLSNLTIGARHALHSHWWLPLFAYRSCLRGLGHLQQRVSQLSWLERTANNRKVRGSSPRGTNFSKSTIQHLCMPHTQTSIGQLFTVHCPNIHCLIAHWSTVPLPIAPRSD